MRFYGFCLRIPIAPQEALRRIRHFTGAGYDPIPDSCGESELRSESRLFVGNVHGNRFHLRFPALKQGGYKRPARIYCRGWITSRPGGAWLWIIPSTFLFAFLLLDSLLFAGLWLGKTSDWLLALLLILQIAYVVWGRQSMKRLLLHLLQTKLPIPSEKETRA